MPGSAHPAPRRGRKELTIPPAGHQGVPEAVPKVLGTWRRSVLQGRAGQGWAPGTARGGSSSSGSRRSSPSPAFQAITWCGGGSAPGAFKEVAPRCRTWDGAGWRGAGGPTEPSRRSPRRRPFARRCAHVPGATHPSRGWRPPLSSIWSRSRDPPRPATLPRSCPKGRSGRPSRPSPASPLRSHGGEAQTYPRSPGLAELLAT